MKRLTLILSLFLSGCVSLSGHERISLQKLQQKGISASVSANGWERPARPWLAGLLNVLPGVGNFYLGSGDAADGVQWAYGIGNLLLWPLSVAWGVPQAYTDAKTLNERDLVFFYQYVKNGQETAVADKDVKDDSYPSWVSLYEKEGYIGQTDKNAVHYIGYGEGVVYSVAHDFAVSDAYEKIRISMVGGDGNNEFAINGLRLISEYKSSESGRMRVWLLYSYPKEKLEKDRLNYKKQKRAN